MKCKINNSPTFFEIDTGSYLSTINISELRKLPDIKINKTCARAKGYGNNSIHFLGEIELNFRCGNYENNHLFYVVSKNNVSLLGRDICSKMNIKLELPDTNINSLKNEVLHKYEDYLSGNFVSCVTEKVSLPMKENSKPIFFKARSVPIRYKKLVHDELQRLQDCNILTKVLSSSWCSPTVNVLKKDNTIRLCGDYSQTINKFMKITRYPLPSIEDVISDVGNAKYFSKIDLQTAFLQVPLDDASKPYTTINTHEGLFMFNFLPLGTSASPAIFQNFVCKVLAEIRSIVIYQDDILIMTETMDQHNCVLDKVLNALKNAGVKINHKKCEFFTEKVNYLGHIFDGEGVHPNQEKIRAIIDAPKPQNIKQLQSFIGLCNFYNRFIRNFSDVFAPLYLLLKKDVEFSWGKDQQKCFDIIKKLFKTDIVLRTFDPNLETALETDASCVGIGAVLMQKYPDGYYPCQFASRSLNSAEKNYSQIEREGLSVIFGCERFKKFLLGKKFVIKNDHLPLRKLFGSNSLIPVTCSARLQRWSLKLSMFEYEFEYIKGIDNVNGDFLSRLPLPETSEIEEPYELIFVIKSLDQMPITCEDIRKHTDENKDLLKLKEYILNGFPSKLDPELAKFNNIIDELSIVKGCIMYRNRVYIPENIRSEVLQQFHANHPGISSMKQLTRALIWYPGLDKDAEEMVRSCSTCQDNQSKPSQNNTVEWPKPERRWSRIHIDHFFYENNIFLVVVDAYSKYIECIIVNSVSSNCTIEALREIFSRNGLSDSIVSDNATSFASYEFKQFCLQNNIIHVTPAPYCPFSNGQAERSVQVIKKLLKKNVTGTIKTRLHNVLLYYRSTPHSITKVAPAVSLNNRKLVTLRDRINPNFVSSNQTEGKKIRCFEVGDNVLVLNVRPGPKWYRGIVVEKLGINIYDVYINDLDMMWRRHTNQLKHYKCNNNDDNVVSADNNNFDLIDIHMGDTAYHSDVAICDTDENNSSDLQTITDVSAQNQTDISADRVLPRRSSRVPKPVIILDL